MRIGQRNLLLINAFILCITITLAFTQWAWLSWAVVVSGKWEFAAITCSLLILASVLGSLPRQPAKFAPLSYYLVMLWFGLAAFLWLAIIPTGKYPWWMVSCALIFDILVVFYAIGARGYLKNLASH